MQIRAKNIVKIFNKKLPTELKALNNVSVEIKENEFIAIIGQTGSGKTTFIEHMNVLLTPDEGEVEFVYKAKDPKTQEVEVIKNIIQKPKSFQKKLKFIKEIRRRVGVVFQFAEYQLFEQTIEKDIIFGAVSMGTPKAEAKERAKEIIKLVGLDESYLPKSPFNLSGGQKRRVAIAGILAMGKNNLIGKGDDLPWYVKEDFDFYREQTKHHDILVGKNTFFTLPKSLQK
ncbi:ATP-binding cassette domain-containing protein [Vibrio harveyi]|nr:ATP-binding cassette domain-containing protein [Vibrio harveyi]